MARDDADDAGQVPNPIRCPSVESASRGDVHRATTPTPILESHNLDAAERQLCELALDGAGSIVEAAKLLGVTRHALKRRPQGNGRRLTEQVSLLGSVGRTAGP